MLGIQAQPGHGIDADVDEAPGMIDRPDGEAGAVRRVDRLHRNRRTAGRQGDDKRLARAEVVADAAQPLVGVQGLSAW
jgi:hypothetical protein